MLIRKAAHRPEPSVIELEGSFLALSFPSIFDDRLPNPLALCIVLPILYTNCLTIGVGNHHDKNAFFLNRPHLWRFSGRELMPRRRVLVQQLHL